MTVLLLIDLSEYLDTFYNKKKTPQQKKEVAYKLMCTKRQKTC